MQAELNENTATSPKKNKTIEKTLKKSLQRPQCLKSDSCSVVVTVVEDSPVRVSVETKHWVTRVVLVTVVRVSVSMEDTWCSSELSRVVKSSPELWRQKDPKTSASPPTSPFLMA